MKLLRTLLYLSLVSLLGGCAVVAVTSTVVGVGASAVGLAADAVVGTVRIGGKVIGATADAVLPGDGDAP
ncbi:hypothetical protein [Variovorax sp. LT1R16]|uniref:hypothetical protein n=1 Tax=Variovorax sp. LT1R16 TaxID=3443728 RepID=UPI003F484861